MASNFDGSIHRHRRRPTHSDVHQEVVYPVHTLPLEITAEIFLQCAASAPADTPDPQHAPWLLLNICQRWRMIALSVPELWSTLCVDFDSIPGGFADGQIEEFAESWLARACARPVSFTLRGWDSRNRLPSGNLDFSAIIRHYTSHVHHLELRIPMSRYHIDLGSFTLLRKLTLGFPFEDREDLTPINILSAAPQLREVQLLDNAHPAILPLPWGQLTTFTGQSFTAEECLNTLRLALSLVEYTFSIEIDSEAITTIPVRHDRLQAFRLVCDNDEQSDRADILNLIQLPALRSLSLVNIANLDINDRRFTPFLVHSVGSLRHFSFSGNQTARMGARSTDWFILPNMARLESVELVNPQEEFMVAFLRLLNRYTRGDGCYIPTKNSSASPKSRLSAVPPPHRRQPDAGPLI
ncbi:hypothetical protein C8R43DRAFT_1229409 [Mycena crocata]|nr:hypothetical protein C8R43DRAFT_1229409 [Mycena crocata]